MPLPAPPGALGAAGAALWTAVLERFDLDAEDRTALAHLARTADVIAALDARIVAEGVIGADGKPTPAVVEHRAQAVAYARLRGALRLPEDDEDAGARPQRRTGVRGPYRLGGAA